MAPEHLNRFNAAKIRRQAHTMSRQNSEQRWNPFRHVDWSRRSPPASRDGHSNTWSGNDLESQRPNRNTADQAEQDDTTSPVAHAATAPDRPYSSDNDHDEPESSREKSDHYDADRKPEGSGDTAVADSQPSVSGAEARNGNLRNRNKEQTAAASTASDGHRDSTDAHADGEDDKKKKKPMKEHRMFKNVQPKHPFTVANQLQRTLLNSWINILLLAAPVGIALGVVESVDRKIAFTVNFIAIIPLAAMLSYSTEEIALRTGETLGGLLNATFGNAVELIVAIMALIKGRVLIVQTSLIGSILSNLLLVMGMCFFFGGLRRQEQFFNTTVAQTAASLLALAVAGVIVPTVFDYNSNTSIGDVAQLSRGTSVILLVVYGAYLFFQLKTHHAVFAQESQKVPAKPFRRRDLPDGAVARGFAGPAGLMGAHGVNDEENKISKALKKKVKRNGKEDEHDDDDDDDEDEHEDPQLHFFVALATLAGSTVLIALCAEFMVDGIGSVVAGGVISEEFVGLILLPIVGNAAEHATAVTVAIKDKMDLAIGVAIGSSMQVALLLIPFLVVIGWGLGNDQMSLSFDLFQVAVLFVAVLLVNYLISDGKSHWLEGMLLMCLYCIIAVCSWWYPATGVAG